ncbi:MAG: phosphoribosylamine--glycine ligase, partial [Anaerolineae bacterium]
IETSKAFSKEFMARHGIPTAAYRTFSSYEAARGYVDSLVSPPVIKADGLAAGKGVVVTSGIQEAHEALRQMMLEREFGEAGGTVVVEEKLSGQEVSLLAFSDGTRLAPMIPAQDHKPALDGDCGPNTGGMGAYAPAPIMDEALRNQVVQQVLEPVIRGLAQEGRLYRGVLYAGMILTEQGPKTLEFNCRFGDPEAQALLPLLDADLAQILLACAQGQLNPQAVRWRPGACVCVVMASGGYPGRYKTGYPIEGIARAEELGCLIFHAGTRLQGSELVTNGGRVLGVAATGADLEEAIAKAYAGVQAIHFQDAHYRTDIGAKGLVLQRS